VSRPDRVKEFLYRLKADADLVTAELTNEAGIVGAALHAADIATP
jgi:hypothetical protein